MFERLYLRVAALTALLIVFLLPLTAYAADGSTQAWWQTLILGLLPHLFEVLAGVITVLLVAVSRRYRLNVDRKEIDGIVDTGLGYGHQLIRRKLKAEEPVDHNDIKSKVAMFVNAQADKQKIGNRAREGLEGLIEARLGLHNRGKDEAPKIIAAEGIK